MLSIRPIDQHYSTALSTEAVKSQRMNWSSACTIFNATNNKSVLTMNKIKYTNHVTNVEEEGL